MPRIRNSAPSYLRHGQSGRGRLTWTDPLGIRRQKLLDMLTISQVCHRYPGARGNARMNPSTVPRWSGFTAQHCTEVKQNIRLRLRDRTRTISDGMRGQRGAGLGSCELAKLFLYEQYPCGEVSSGAADGPSGVWPPALLRTHLQASEKRVGNG